VAHAMVTTILNQPLVTYLTSTFLICFRWGSSWCGDPLELGDAGVEVPSPSLEADVVGEEVVKSDLACGHGVPLHTVKLEP